MGDEVLMKKLAIIPVLALNMLANSSIQQGNKEALIQEYKEMFQKISKRRIGIDETKIDNLKSPFLEVKREVKVDKKMRKEGYVQPFALQAIFGSKVKISGSWYKLGDEVNGMKLISVNGNHVWLKNENFRKKLVMGSKNEKISIK